MTDTIKDPAVNAAEEMTTDASASAIAGEASVFASAEEGPASSKAESSGAADGAASAEDIAPAKEKSTERVAPAGSVAAAGDALRKIASDEYDEDDEDYEDYDDSIGIQQHTAEDIADEDDDLPAEDDFDDALPEAYATVRKGSILKGVLPQAPVIVFDHVTKEYEDGPEDQDRRALKDVSFRINKGEFVFIVGPSGSGKSTLIRLLMREIRPTEGSIYIAGTDLAKLRNSQVCKYRRSIGIVFQDFRLLEDRTVYENIAFAQKVIGAPSRKITRNVAKMLSIVGLRHKYKSFPNKLSGGEQQRVALARALVNNPLILLADEPTGNLDPVNTQEIMELLEDINARGTTVVVVTHNHEIVDAMQKRVIVLNEGVIVNDKKGGYKRG